MFVPPPIFRPKFGQYLAYKFELLLKSALTIQLLMLAFLVAVGVARGSFFGWLAGVEGSIWEIIWWAYLRVTDPGYLGEDGDPYRALAGSFVIFAGLAVFGLLVSLLNNWLQQHLDDIRRGNRQIIARDHVLILGWGNSVYTIVDEILAGTQTKSGRSAQVFILCDQDPEVTHTLIDRRCRHRLRHRVLCRMGDIGNLRDLQALNIGVARKVIILSDDLSDQQEAENARSVKALFASLLAIGIMRPETLKRITQAQSNSLIGLSKDGTVGRFALPGPFHARIGMSVTSHNTCQVLRFLDSDYQNAFVHVVDQHDFIARVIALTSLQPGLELVFAELFKDIGCEVYTTRVGDLTQERVTFETMLFSTKGGIPIGFYRKNEKEDLLELFLNPNAKHPSILDPDDLLVWIGEDDDAITFHKTDLAPIKTQSSAKPDSVEPMRLNCRRILLVGKGRKLAALRGYLSGYLSGDCQIDEWNEEFIPAVSAIPESHNMYHPGSMTGVSGEWSFQLKEGYDLIILADTGGNNETHDAEILLKTVQVIHEVERFRKPGEYRLVAEFLDPASARLALLADANPLASLGIDTTSDSESMVRVISTRLLSDYIVQILREPLRRPVFEELLDPSGNEFGLFPLNCYQLKEEGALTFNDIRKRAWRSGQIAIGYIQQGKLFLSPKDSDASRKLEGAGVRIVSILDFQETKG